MRNRSRRLRKFFEVLFFLSPRRRSGERTEERIPRFKLRRAPLNRSEHSTFNIERSTLNEGPKRGRWRFDVECWLLNVFFWFRGAKRARSPGNSLLHPMEEREENGWSIAHCGSFTSGPIINDRCHCSNGDSHCPDVQRRLLLDCLGRRHWFRQSPTVLQRSRLSDRCPGDCR